MKINHLFLAVVLVVICSGIVLAQNQYTGVFTNPYDIDMSSYFADGGAYEDYNLHVGDDGVVFFNDTDSANPGQYTNLEQLNRESTPDTNGNNQSVSITVGVDAYIPCFLEMKLTGNQGTTAAISYGANTSSEATGSGYHIVFDNEVGGFLDADWKSLGHGSNAEINPEDNVYIGACDIFAVEIISNDNYRYAVEASALTSVDAGTGAELPMDMRTSLDGGTAWNQVSFNTTSLKEETIVSDGQPGIKTEALHSFRVPYSMDINHGHYDGEIVFRAATI
jgi:hypothetical protein